MASVHVCVLECEGGVTTQRRLVSNRSALLAFIIMHLHSLAQFPTLMAVTKLHGTSLYLNKGAE